MHGKLLGEGVTQDLSRHRGVKESCINNRFTFPQNTESIISRSWLLRGIVPVKLGT
jgi:hypothetical protein